MRGSKSPSSPGSKRPRRDLSPSPRSTATRQPAYAVDDTGSVYVHGQALCGHWVWLATDGALGQGTTCMELAAVLRHHGATGLHLVRMPGVLLSRISDGGEVMNDWRLILVRRTPRHGIHAAGSSYQQQKELAWLPLVAFEPRHSQSPLVQRALSEASAAAVADPAVRVISFQVPAIPKPISLLPGGDIMHASVSAAVALLGLGVRGGALGVSRRWTPWLLPSTWRLPPPVQLAGRLALQ